MDGELQVQRETLSQKIMWRAIEEDIWHQFRAFTHMNVHLHTRVCTYELTNNRKIQVINEDEKKEKGPIANLTYFWYTPQLDDSPACLELMNGPYYAHTNSPYYAHTYSLSLVICSFICRSHFVRPGAPVYQGWDSTGSHLQERWWQMATSIHSPTWSNWPSRTFQLQV